MKANWGLIEAAALLGPGRLRTEQNPLLLLAARNEVRTALQTLDEHLYTTSATSSLYTDQRTIELARDGEWSLTCTKMSTDAPVLTTCPGDVVMHVLSCAEPLAVSFYDVDGFPAKGDLPRRMRPLPRETATIAEGDAVVVPSGAYAACIRGSLRDARFLRASREASETLVASFDPDDLTLRAVSFVRHEDTARHFFAALLREVHARDDDRRSPYSTSSALERFLAKGLADDTHLFTKWKLAQLASRESPPLALAFLMALATSDKVNAAAMADAALSKHGSR